MISGSDANLRDFNYFLAKKARGLMTRHIVKNRITDVTDIKRFAEQGYAFAEALSEGDSWVFVRDHG